MEANREEAARCLQLGRQALASGDIARARRLGARSISLFSTDAARDFVAGLDNAKPSGTSSANDSNSREGASSTAKQRKKRAGSRSRSPPKKARDWTPEQEDIVKKVNKKPALAFYEILELPRNASDAEIKKAYRKLALQLHPDKNSAPNAEDAFKKVSKAFSILSDPDKRRSYDESGADPDTRGAGGMGGGGFARGFAGGADNPFAGAFTGGEFDAEEIFRAFFGNGMNTGFAFHTGGFGTHPLRQRHRHRHPSYQQQAQEDQPQLEFLQMIRGLLTILIPMIVMLWLSPASAPDFPRFAFTPTRNLDQEFRTNPLSVPFFANAITLRNFKSRYSQHMPKFFAHIESTYEEVLEAGCKQERAAQDRLFWRARGFGILSADKKLLNQAENMKLHTCLKQTDYYQRKSRHWKNKGWF